MADDRFWEQPRQVPGGSTAPRPAADPLAGARELGAEDLGSWRRGAAYLLAQGLTSDPAMLEGIVRQLAPEAQIFRNERGEMGVMMPDGQRYFLNRPGASRSDIVNMVGQMAAGIGASVAAGRFLGPGSAIGARVGSNMLARAMPAILGRVLPQAGAAGAVSVGSDVAAGGMGGEAGVDLDKAALSTGLGGAGEAAAPHIAALAGRVVRFLRGAPAAHLVTGAGELTETFRQALTQAGMDPASMSAAQLEAIGTALRQAGAQNADQALELARRVQAGGTTSEFGIPLTAGQRTNQPGQLATEDALRGGALGQEARTQLQGFDATQREAVDAAAERLRQSVGGGARPLSEAEAGATIGSAARARYDAAKEAENAAWTAWREGVNPRQTPVAREGVQGLQDAVLRSVEDFPVGDNTPTAKVVLERLGRFGRAGNRADGELGEVSLLEVDGLRRYLGHARGNSREDSAALGQIRRTFDSWLDGLVDRALIAGDDQAIDGLKQAIGSSRQRFALTNGPAGRGVSSGTTQSIGQRLESLAMDREATGQQVVNWLYGRSALDAGGEQRRMLSSALGGLLSGEGGEPARQALRQAAVLRLVQGATEDSGGYLRIANRMREALRGNGAEVSRMLFDGEQLATLGRFEEQLRTLARQRTSANPSGSGFTVLGALTSAGLIGAPAALGLGPELGGAAGAAAGILLGRPAANLARDAAGSRAVSQALQAAPTPEAAGALAAAQDLASTPLLRFLRRAVPGSAPAVSEPLTQ